MTQENKARIELNRDDWVMVMAALYRSASYNREDGYPLLAIKEEKLANHIQNQVTFQLDERG